MNEINKALEALKDEDGENRAVRAFLMIYGTPGLTAAAMAAHMRRSGFDYVPAWVERSPEFLTKAGAQLWLRMLFALESPASPAAADVQDDDLAHRIAYAIQQTYLHELAAESLEQIKAVVENVLDEEDDALTVAYLHGVSKGVDPVTPASLAKAAGVKILAILQAIETLTGVKCTANQKLAQDLIGEALCKASSAAVGLAAQCGESCERAKLCGACARGLEEKPEPVASDFTDTGRAALLWVLWHHQGGSSPVGQPIRFALGMGADERLGDARIEEAKRWAALAGWSTEKVHKYHPPASPYPPGEEALRQETARLDYVLQAGAFISWSLRDGTIRQCQVMVQNEDEDYEYPAGEHRFFNTEREAIDAALSASNQNGGE